MDIAGVIRDGLLLFCTVSAVYPPLRSIDNNTWYCVFAVAGWLFWAFLKAPRFFLIVPCYRALTYVFIGYTIIIPYLFGTYTLGNRYVCLLLLALGATIYQYYCNQHELTSIRNIIAVTVVFAVITWYRTASALILNPSISRSIKSGGDYTAETLGRGIGGYEFIYFVCINTPILLWLAMRLRKKWMRILALLSWLGALAIVILSNYYTALFISIVSSVILLYFQIGSKGKSQLLIITVAVVFVFLIFGGPIQDGFVRLVTAIAPQGKTADRLMKNSSIVEGIIREFKGDRFPTMIVSIKSWLSHPGMGLVTEKNTVSGVYLQNVGQHSHILDTFAIFGTPIGLINCYMLFQPFAEMCRRSNNSRPLIYAVSFAYFAILFFNNATPSLAVAAYMILPYVAQTSTMETLHFNAEKVIV